MRRSVTQDALHDYGRNGLGLVCTNAGKASVFSLLRQSCNGTVPAIEFTEAKGRH